jgi:hypothetical protein
MKLLNRPIRSWSGGAINGVARKQRGGWAKIPLHHDRACFETRSGFAEALLSMTVCF